VEFPSVLQVGPNEVFDFTGARPRNKLIIEDFRHGRNKIDRRNQLGSGALMVVFPI
jgi:hypothetical protein